MPGVFWRSVSLQRKMKRMKGIPIWETCWGSFAYPHYLQATSSIAIALCFQSYLKLQNSFLTANLTFTYVFRLHFFSNLMCIGDKLDTVNSLSFYITTTEHWWFKKIILPLNSTVEQQTMSYSNFHSLIACDGIR